MKVNSGNDTQAAQMGGDVVGAVGTATGTSATTLTDSGATWTTNAFAGHVVVSAGVYGVVISNTGTVLTVDRWNNPATPGGTAGTTPGNVAYAILPGNAPSMFVALSTNTTTVGSSDTDLSASSGTEITTSSGGLIRKIAVYAHTASATSYTLTTVFTANGSDSLPVTVGKMGVFQTVKGATGKALFLTLVSPTATLSASGDQLTLTSTVSL